MVSEHLSMRIPAETKKRLEELANATGRTKAYLALEAIEKYLDAEAWQVAAIKSGINDVYNSETMKFEDVKSAWGI